MNNLKNVLLHTFLLFTLVALGGCSGSRIRDSESDQQKILAKAEQAYLKGDYLNTIRLLAPLSQQGNSQARYTLGYMYYNGQGVKQDFKKALILISQAAAANHPKAVVALEKITRGETVSRNQTSSDARNNVKIINVTPVEEEIIRPSASEQPEKTGSTVNPPNPQSEETRIPKESPDTRLAESRRAPPAPASKKELPAWLNKIPDHYYTIQLVSSPFLNSIRNFISRHDLQNTRILKKNINNNSSYILITGEFPSRNKAYNQLPAFKQKGIKDVWIRNFGGIKEGFIAQ